MILKAILINIILLAVYCALIISGAKVADRGFSMAIIGGICMALQVGLNVFAGLILLVIGKREIAKSFLIAGGIMAPVCFCSWLILLSIYG